VHKGLTTRAIILGFILSIAVAMYSAYLGLMVGGVYWPIVTTSLMCMALLKLLGKTNKKEIVIAQTAASTGGLLAAGIIFTIPAIYLMGMQISIIEIMLIALGGGLLGILFTIPLRKEMIEREKLPYPDGRAAATLIEAGDKGGKKAKFLAKAFGIGSIFAIVRDYFKAIPTALNIDMTGSQLAKYFSIGTGISLVSIAGGYLIGPVFTGVWFLGAVLSHLIIVPFLTVNGFFASKNMAMTAFTSPLGIGIVIGAAIAYFLLKGVPYIKKMVKQIHTNKKTLNKNWVIVFIATITIITIALKLDPLLSTIAIVSSFFMAYIGARVTGEMNVDPMEIFAMIVLILVRIFLGFNAIPLIAMAAIICIAAGMGGDFMQDLKAGHMLKAKPRDQIITQTIGVIGAALVLGFVLTALQATYGIGTPKFPAPQAQAIAAIVSAGKIATPMLAGIAIGFIATVILTLALKAGIVMVAFGIGLYVPIELSLPLFVGGILRFIADKKNKTEKGRLIAAGVIAGEGLIGVIIALLGFAGFITL